ARAFPWTFPFPTLTHAVDPARAGRANANTKRSAASGKDVRIRRPPARGAVPESRDAPRAGGIGFVRGACRGFASRSGPGELVRRLRNALRFRSQVVSRRIRLAGPAVDPGG